MKIFSFYTNSHRALKDIFISSLRDRYEIIIECIDGVETAEKKLKDGKHIGGGIEIWLYKTKKVISAIRDNFGKNIIFADIDIKFFKRTESSILKHIGEFDILFQSDVFGTKAVNIGFMVIKCNHKTLFFFERVLAKIENQGIWDQRVVCSMLESSQLRENNSGFIAEDELLWNHLPLNFLPWHMVSSKYILLSFQNLLTLVRLNFKKIILCHATEFAGLSDPCRKLDIYQECQRAINHQLIFKAHLFLRFLFFNLKKLIAKAKRQIKRKASKIKNPR